MRHIKGLDTLRAFAALFVVITHLGVWFDNTSSWGRFISIVLIPSGKFGVDLFFVLSGFLITSLLLRAKQDSTANNLTIVRNFFIRRSLRIFPIYFLLLFFLYTINYPDVRKYFPYFATYTANLIPYRTNAWNLYGHTWTLAVEEQFYLLWPWLVIYIKNKHLKSVFIAMIATGIISSYIGVALQGHIEPFLVFNFFDAFGLGGLYAYLRHEGTDAKTMKTAIKWLTIPSLALCLYWKLTGFYELTLHADFLMKTANSVIALYLIMLVVNNKSQFAEKLILNNKPLNYLGTISYGIYLFHVPYLNYFYKPVNTYLYNITVSHPTLNRIVEYPQLYYWKQLVIIILIATISYNLIERPLLFLKRYFEYNEKKPELQPAS